MAKYKYSTNTDPTKASYGESSLGVSALQKQLNQKYAGTQGYTLLKEDGKYGPLTQAASKFQAPTVAPTVPVESTPAEYLDRTNARSEELKKLRSIVTDTGNEPSLENTRNSLLKNSQSIIDSITAQYANTIQQERDRGEVLNKRQRGLNIASGLQGSDFASANAQQVEDETMKAVQAIESERDAKIAATLEGIAFRSQEVYENQKNQYRQNAEDALTKFDEFRQSALEDVGVFASSGYTAEQIRKNSPQTWKQLLEQTGYTDAGLQAAFIASKPEPDFQERVGNSLIYGYRDPQTGKISTEKIELPVEYTDLKTFDGEPYFVNVDKGIITKAAGYTPKPKSTSATGKLASESEYNNRLEQSRGEDDYVDPAVYKDFYEAWIENGGTTKNFLTKYPAKNYVNPENKTLPLQLRNNIKKTTATPVISFSE